MKKIVILPVYNEGLVLRGVLEKVSSVCDFIILIDDGSTDGSAQICLEWAEGNPRAFFKPLKENVGKAGALRAGFEAVLELQESGIIKKKDLLIITDADGQLPLEIIGDACDYFIKEKADMLIGSRDFSIYPPVKKIGNYILSALASFLSGYNFRDTQCGFRIFSVGTLGQILPYYKAKRYSCEQEISLIAAILKLKVDNSYPVKPLYYRSNSTFTDAFRIAFASFAVWARLNFYKKR